MQQTPSRRTLTPMRAAALLAAMSVGGLVLGQTFSPRGTPSTVTSSLSTLGGSGRSDTLAHVSPAQVVVATHVPRRAPVALASSSASANLTTLAVTGRDASSEPKTPPGHGDHHDHQAGNSHTHQPGNSHSHGHGHGGHGGHGS